VKYIDDLARDMDRKVWDSLITAMLDNNEDPTDDHLWKTRKIELARALETQAEGRS
jgi:hypothetical protein